MKDNYFLNLALEAALEAGKKTLTYYRANNFDIDIKSDNSPLTQADIDSNAEIEDKLKQSKIPILSEETAPEEYAVRKNWECFWLIDPLDGTKEFIKHSDEYTVNIAFIEKNSPTLGVVFAPAKDILFYGVVGEGAYKIEEVSQKTPEEIVSGSVNKIKLPACDSSASDKTIVVASKSHRNSETDAFINKLEKKNGQVEVQSFGSSLKLCMVAEGSAHIYPRMGSTMEWDTAASHAVVLASGCNILQFPSLENMTYNKENLLNPWFVVFQPDMEKSISVN